MNLAENNQKYARIQGKMKCRDTRIFEIATDDDKITFEVVTFTNFP